MPNKISPPQDQVRQPLEKIVEPGTYNEAASAMKLDENWIKSKPWTLSGVASNLNKATLGSPNKYLPKWMTGAGPRGALFATLGGLAGRYAFPSVMRYMNPRAANNPVFDERAGNVGTVLGLLAGAGLAAPDMYASFQSARGKNPDGSRGSWTGGFKGLHNGWDNIPPNPAVKQGSEKEAGFWDKPTINPATLSNATRMALYNGEIDPVAVLQADQALDNATTSMNGYLTPRSIGDSIKDTAMHAGAGALSGYIAGRVGGAMLGAFGMLSPEAQSKAGPATALVGAVANVLSGSTLFK